MNFSNKRLTVKGKNNNAIILLIILALVGFLLFRVYFVKEEGFDNHTNKTDKTIVDELDSVCSILETQDKIKFEKQKLERNKSYALKLKQQQDEIKKLEMIIESMKEHNQERLKREDIINMIRSEKMNIDTNKLKLNLDERLRNQDSIDVDAQITLDPRLN